MSAFRKAPVTVLASEAWCLECVSHHDESLFLSGFGLGSSSLPVARKQPDTRASAEQTDMRYTAASKIDTLVYSQVATGVKNRSLSKGRPPPQQPQCSKLLFLVHGKVILFLSDIPMQALGQAFKPVAHRILETD